MLGNDEQMSVSDAGSQQWLARHRRAGAVIAWLVAAGLVTGGVWQLAAGYVIAGVFAVAAGVCIALIWGWYVPRHWFRASDPPTWL